MNTASVAIPYEEVQLNGKIQLVSLPEWSLAGIAVTCAFKGEVVSRVERTKQEFYNRAGELPKLRPERYMCVHFTTFPTLFTYIFSMEIDSSEGIAEDWLLYTLPARTYAAVRSDGDPYADIQAWLAAQGLEADQQAEAIEVYSFANPVWPAGTDVLVPIKITKESR